MRRRRGRAGERGRLGGALVAVLVLLAAVAALSGVAAAKPSRSSSRSSNSSKSSTSSATSASRPAAAPNASLASTPLPAGEAVTKTLGEKRYRFCHDPKYPLTKDEVEWCELLPREPDPHATRCPDFARACTAGATAKVVPLVREEKSLDFQPPSFGGLGRMLLYLLAAVAAGLLIFAIVRGALGLKRPQRREEKIVAPVDDGAAAAAAAANAVIERDVDRLLARARAAAAAGDFVTAVGDVHAALLRRLEGDGHIRIHASATNGDYVRELRTRAPNLAAPVREVARDVEAVQFSDGSGGPGSGNVDGAGAAYQSVLARVLALLGRAGAGPLVVLLAVVLFASCNQGTRVDWRYRPAGSAGVAEFLTAAGVDTHERLRPLREIADQESHKADGPRDARTRPAQVVLLPDAEIGDAEWASLRIALDGDAGLTVVVTGERPLPSWLPVEVVERKAAKARRGAVRATQAMAERAARRRPEDEGYLAKLEARAPGAGSLRMGGNGTSDYVRLLDRDIDAYAVELEIGAGHVIVLADNALYTNASLVVGDNAELLLALMRLGDSGPVDVVTEETGIVAETPLDSVARGRLAPFLAQLGACLILFFLLKGVAFGRPIDPQVVRRRSFSEHVTALGVQYARARAARHAAGAYAAWAVDRLRERIHLPGDRAVSDLAAAVAVRTGRPIGEVARLLFEARRDEGAAEPAGEPRTRAVADEHLATMRALRQLLAETGRGAGAGAGKDRAGTAAAASGASAPPPGYGAGGGSGATRTTAPRITTSTMTTATAPAATAASTEPRKPETPTP